jgi:hypothetical protein
MAVSPNGTTYTVSGGITEATLSNGKTFVANTSAWSSPEAYISWLESAKGSGYSAELASMNEGFGDTRTYSTMPEDLQASFPDGTVRGYVEYLLDAAKRQVNIFKDTILDFSFLETDPNFSREYETNLATLDTLMGRVSLGTQLETLFRGSLFVTTAVNRFIGDLFEKASEIQAQIDMAARTIMKFVQDFTSLNWIRDSLFAGLSELYSNAIINFPILEDIKNGIAGAIFIYDAVKNGALVDLLKNTVSSIIPVDAIMSQVNSILEIPQNVANAVQGVMSNFVQSPIGSLISSGSLPNFHVNLSLDDPFGIFARRTAVSEIKSNVLPSLKEALSANVEIAGYTENVTLLQAIEVSASETIDNAFKGSIGLPSILTCTSAVVKETVNRTRETMLGAIDNLQETIISGIGLNPTPEDSEPEDYLINVKKSLRTRVEASIYGASSESLEQVNDYLSTVFKNPTDVNDQKIMQDTYAMLLDIWGETPEIC